MKNKNRTIIVDFGDRNQYQEMISNGKAFMEFVVAYILAMGFQMLHKKHCTGGNCFTRHSHYARVKSNNTTVWRMECKTCGAVFTIIPSFLMRYFRHDTETVKNALIAYHGGLSLENCSICFNISAMSLYRIICAFGKYSIAAILTTVGIALPKDCQVDEKHSKCLSEKCYIPLITSGHAIWHIDHVQSLDDDVLEDSYRKFANETKAIDAEYTPRTITHDGYKSTINALKKIFNKVTFLICWMHSCWSLAKLIGSFSREEGENLSQEFFDKLKECYRKTSLKCISLKNWFTAISRHYKNILPGDLYEKLNKWIKWRKPYFYASMDYSFPLSFSYSIDHICNHLDRKLFMMKYFHNPEARIDLFLKGFALIHTFIPYQRFAKNAHKSPAHVEGAKLPHPDWFVSLLMLTFGSYHKI